MKPNHNRRLIAELLTLLLVVLIGGQAAVRANTESMSQAYLNDAGLDAVPLAITRILSASADAMVDASDSGGIYGSQPGMSVGYSQVDLTMSRALIRFDLSNIPVGTTINSARLQLYITESSPADDVTLEVARMTEDWDETTVTWANGHQDTIEDLEPPITKVVGLATRVWIELSVTDLVQSWLDGDFPNYGLALHGPEWNTEYIRTFASRESAAGSSAPRLIVNYGPADPRGDLSVDDVEVTQGIQCLDNTVGDTDCADNSIPLVERRPTYVRVFVDTGAAIANLGNVNARLRRVIDGDAVYIHAYNGPISAPPLPNRGSTNHTLNFLLPLDWWAGSYQFDVELDPDDLLDETNEGNNSQSIEVDFHARKSLKIYYSPISFDPEGDGIRIEPTNRIHRAYRWLYNTFPLAEVSYIERPTLIWQHDVNVDDNHTRLINTLYQLWALEGLRDSTAYKQIYAGWLPANSYDKNGLSDPLWAGGTQIPVFANDTPNMFRRTLAHEIAHNFNRYHVGNDDHWPYDNNQIQETGFDIENRAAVAATKLDVMVPAQPENAAWISPYTYRALYDWIGAPALAAQVRAAEAPIERALITGFIRRDGTGELNPLYRYQALGPAAATLSGTDFCLHFRDAGDRLLAQRCFDVAFAENDSPDQRDTAPFGLLEPWPADTAVMQLTKAGAILDQLTVSAKPPTIQIDEPNGGELWDGAERITWHGNDPDGDPLVYAVLYSADAGASWIALATGLHTTELEVDSTVLPGSERALIRIMASDGARTTEARSNVTFRVARKPPTATIFQPESGARIEVNDPLMLQGEGYDREDGQLKHGALIWRSDRDGLLGVGDTLVLTTLSVGHHRLTLEAKDADKNVARAMVEIDVIGAATDSFRTYLPLLVRGGLSGIPTSPPIYAPVTAPTRMLTAMNLLSATRTRFVRRLPHPYQ
jgi:hypothetical protein